MLSSFSPRLSEFGLIRLLPDPLATFWHRSGTSGLMSPDPLSVVLDVEDRVGADRWVWVPFLLLFLLLSGWIDWVWVPVLLLLLLLSGWIDWVWVGVLLLLQLLSMQGCLGWEEGTGREDIFFTVFLPLGAGLCRGEAEFLSRPRLLRGREDVAVVFLTPGLVGETTS